MTLILGFFPALVIIYMVVVVIIGLHVLAWMIAATFLVLAALAVGISYLFGLDDPKSILWMVLVPGAVISLFVYSYLKQRQEEKEAAERQAKEEAERRRREASERQRRQMKLAKAGPVERWARSLFD